MPVFKYFPAFTPPLALAAVMALSAPALAYDSSDCAPLNPSAKALRASEFTLETSAADFGDGPRIFDNLDDAVICWYADGRVAVLGDLYLDKQTGPFQTMVTVAFAGDGRSNRQVARASFTNLVKGKQKLSLISKPGFFRGALVSISIYQNGARRPLVREVARKYFAR